MDDASPAAQEHKRVEQVLHADDFLPEQRRAPAAFAAAQVMPELLHAKWFRRRRHQLLLSLRA